MNRASGGDTGGFPKSRNIDMNDELDLLEAFMKGCRMCLHGIYAERDNDPFMICIADFNFGKSIAMSRIVRKNRFLRSMGARR